MIRLSATGVSQLVQPRFNAPVITKPLIFWFQFFLQFAPVRPSL